MNLSNDPFQKSALEFLGIPITSRTPLVCNDHSPVRFVRASEVQGIATIEASIDEVFAEGEQWGGGHGVFTYYLLKGLAGDADQNRDDTVTASELFLYAERQVSKATADKQLPMISVSHEGNVPLDGIATGGRGVERRTAQH
jgi:hypothetical protein